MTLVDLCESLVSRLLMSVIFLHILLYIEATLITRYSKTCTVALSHLHQAFTLIKLYGSVVAAGTSCLVSFHFLFSLREAKKLCFVQVAHG